jgi:predicted dehydrogenase
MNHWSLDAAEGGRIIGEACHFIDLAAALTGSVPAVVASFVVLTPGVSALSAQTAYVQMRMRNGSLASLTYVADGAQSVSKERIECHGSGKSALIDDWRELVLYNNDKRPLKRRSAQSKGQSEMITAFLTAIRSGTPAVPPSVLFAVSEATLSIIESSCAGRQFFIADYAFLDKRS